MKRNICLAVLILLCICFFAACSGGQNGNHSNNSKPTEHTHSFGEWKTTEKPTCTQNGIEVRYCNCGEKQTESIAALGHTEVIDDAVNATCTDTGLTEGKHCSVCNEILVEQTIVDFVGHTFADRHCTVCKMWEFSVGLDFTSNNDGTCSVSGIGTCTDTVLIIPDYSPDNEKVTSINSNAFSGYQDVKKVVLPEGLIKIGAGAFSDCRALTSIIIPETVTVIDSSALSGCLTLNNVILPESLTKIGRYAFQYCWSLESITIPDGITMLEGAMFFDCKSLVEVNIPNSVTYMEASVFYGCTALESIVIPASVKQIDTWVFKDCTSLTSIYFECNEEEFKELIIDPEYAYSSNAVAYCYIETEPTKYGNYWHYVDGVITPWPDYYKATLGFRPNDDGTCYLSSPGSCTASEIIVPPVSLKGDKVIGVGETAFIYNDYLVKISLPDTIITIEAGAFQGCKSLTSVIMCEGVTTINRWAFYYCTSLESIVIPKSVTMMEYGAFGECTSLNSIFYGGSEEDWNSIYIETMYGIPFETINRFYYSENAPTEKGNFWHYVDGVPTVWPPYVIPDSVGLEYTDNGDGTCYVSGIGTCTDTIIKIPAISPDGYTVTGIGWRAFDTYYGDENFDVCSAITAIVVPNTVTEISGNIIGQYGSFSRLYYVGTAEEWANVTIDEYGNEEINADTVYFYSEEYPATNGKYWHYDVVPTPWVIGLEYTLNEDGTCYVSGIGNCTDTDLIIPETSPDGKAVVGIGGSAFCGCDSFVSVYIPDSVIYIGEYAFSSCYSLKSVRLSKNITSIESYAFSGCFDLESIEIPYGVTEIKSGAFSSSPLYTVYIPVSVILIEETAFNCLAINPDIYYYGSEEEWQAIEIVDTSDYLNTATVHYNYIPEE